MMRIVLFTLVAVVMLLSPSASAKKPNVLFLFLAWLLICMTGAVGPIANHAHAFGLISGMVIGAARGFWEKTSGAT